MITAGKGRLVALAAVAVGATVALAGCASGDPLDGGSTGDASSETLVVGSQDYYSNEIIAEIYAQALEENGYTIDRQFRIGQRNAFPAFEYGILGMAAGGLRSVKVAPQLTHYERKLNPALPENVPLRYEIELLHVSDQWDNTIYESTDWSPPPPESAP